MGTHDLLRSLREAGFRVKATEGRLLVAPASKLTEELRTSICANRAALLEQLTLQPVPTESATAATVRQGHDRTAEAAKHDVVLAGPGSVRGTDDDRLRTAREENRAYHTSDWNRAELEFFLRRSQYFAVTRRANHERLAEQLIRRDREGDDRRICPECAFLTQAGRCHAAARGRLPGAGRHHEPVQTMLHRCPAFALAEGLE